MPLFGAAYAAPNKGTTILYLFRSPKRLLNPPVNDKIQGLFKVIECFSSTFQGNFNFRGLFKTVLYIQVLFKPVRTLVPHMWGFSCCSFYGSGSVVVYSLFTVAPIVWWGCVFGACFVMQYFVSISQSSRWGCFTLIVFLMSCGCYCSLLFLTWM